MDDGQRIRELGYRLTPQRQLILDVLRELGGHATANEVYERVHDRSPAVNLATVYRTLSFLCDIRLAASATMMGQTVYEILDETPHHHLICLECEAVELLADHHFEALAEHLRQEHGFEPVFDHMAIYGLCQACQKDGE